VGNELREIPLFPLDVVLFPGMALPLHIFEPRYREMTARCLDSDVPFGVVLALPESEQGREVPAHVGTVGTMARISDYERLPDGRYNLLATGTERFEIIELRDGKPYLTGLVRPLSDLDTVEAESSLEATAPNGHGSVAALAAQAQAALEAYLRQVLTLLGSGDCEITIPTDPIELSYVIGMCLTCEDCEKQELLEARTAAERLAKGTAFLRAEAEALTHQIESETQPSARWDRSRLN
jgi:Lon protease-like protein